MKGGEIPPDIARTLNEIQGRTTAQEYGRFILNALRSTGLVGRPFNETPIGQAASLRGRPIEEQLAVSENDPAFGFAGTTIGKGIRAFHGSPYNFDKFDLGKIGTGEGAQAYGHGLYFAENENVAASYKHAVSGRKAINTFDGVKLDGPESYWEAVDKLNKSGDWPLAKALEYYSKQIEPDQSLRIKQMKDWFRNDTKMMDAINRMEPIIKTETPPGHMYEVNINASPDEFLDWDKPLGEQPAAVRDGLKRLGYDDHPYDMAITGPDANERFTFNSLAEAEREAGHWRAMDHDAAIIPRDDVIRSGADVYRDLQSSGGGRVWGAESQKLKDQGIAGIKYLDQGSRGAGDGSRNYVVFNPSVIEIMRKYGILGPTAGALSYNGKGE